MRRTTWRSGVPAARPNLTAGNVMVAPTAAATCRNCLRVVGPAQAVAAESAISLCPKRAPSTGSTLWLRDPVTSGCWAISSYAVGGCPLRRLTFGASTDLFLSESALVYVLSAPPLPLLGPGLNVSARPTSHAV